MSQKLTIGISQAIQVAQTRTFLASALPLTMKLAWSKHGPTTLAVDHALHFEQLKREYAAWLPRDIVVRLEPLETTVRRLGSHSSLIRALEGNDPKGRADAIKKAFAEFSELMQMDQKVH